MKKGKGKRKAAGSTPSVPDWDLLTMALDATAIALAPCPHLQEATAAFLSGLYGLGFAAGATRAREVFTKWKPGTPFSTLAELAKLNAGLLAAIMVHDEAQHRVKKGDA